LLAIGAHYPQQARRTGVLSIVVRITGGGETHGHSVADFVNSYRSNSHRGDLGVKDKSGVP